MNRFAVIHVGLTCAALSAVVYGVARTFGWPLGWAAGAALWLLMPYAPVSKS